MKVDCRFIPVFPDKPDLSDKTAVVIDVLRATSSIVTAFEQGAREIIPVASIEEARNLFGNSREGETVLLAGERNAEKIDGFHLGNSPYDFGAERVKNASIILTTTNGSRALVAVRVAKLVIAASLLNVSAAADKVLSSGNDVEIVCSGSELRFSLEDALCAGFLVNDILARSQNTELSDSAIAASVLVKQFKKDVVGAVLNSEHGKTLIEHGYEKDVRFCAQVNSSNLVPVYANSRLTIR